MPEFTVTAVEEKGPVQRGSSTNHKFYVSLKNDDDGTETHKVYWERKSPDLEVGERVSGSITEGEYGPRFQRPEGGNAYRVPGAVQIQNDPRRVDPERWSIERQTAAKCTAEVLKGQPVPSAAAFVEELVDVFHAAIRKSDDADVGSGQAAHGASDNHPPVAEDAADLSADISNSATITTANAPLPMPPEQASPQLKATLTKLFHAAGLSRDAMKAVVLFRCGAEKATKQGAESLIKDLQEGATHDALLAEIYDAKRAGNPLGVRAAALIPTEVPWEDDNSLPPVPEKDITT